MDLAGGCSVFRNILWWICQLAIEYNNDNNYMDGALTVANYHFSWSEKTDERASKQKQDD